MAVFAIPNPKKSTQVDFPIEKVKLSVQNISLRNNKYKFSKANEIFNQYTYESLEFLSLGVYIDINLNKINEDKTEITVEIRRKIGTFNQSHEITKANEHIEKTFECIAFLTTKSPEEIEQYRASQTINKVANNSKKDFENGEDKPWYEKKGLVILLCVLFFPVGLYALWKNSSISKNWKIGVTVIISVIVLANLGDKKENSTVSSSKTETQESENTSKNAESSKDVGIGQVLKTNYFEITVNKAEVKDNVNTGNEFSDLKQENGISYLVINATFKNIDNESRMLEDGSVWINYNGKDYEFDKSETIMAEGWSLMLDQINPLTSKTTNLVYKIPNEVKGNAYWQPGRADEDEKILLGTL